MFSLASLLSKQVLMYITLKKKLTKKMVRKIRKDGEEDSQRWVRGVANGVNKYSFNATFLYPLLIEEKELKQAVLSDCLS